jgi:hypothetical protein
MKDFRQLKVWEKAHQLALAVYKVTKSFPKEELYGLTSQIRRASMSIPTNIAEGCGRQPMRSLRVFFKSPWAPPVKPNINSCLPATLNFSPMNNIKNFTTMSPR